MRIGELARRTGLSRDTIRFYERQELIESAPSTEASNDYRDYPDETVERLAMITEARTIGMPVADLRQLLRAMEGKEAGDFNANAFIDDKIVEVRALIERSKRLLALLVQTRAALNATPGDVG